MNDLERYFQANTGNLIHKWKHYFEIYDRHFSRYRNTDAVIVEFGVFHGGSLQMWKNYFGPRAQIIGIDINPQCKILAEDQVRILIGDQEDRTFLRSLIKDIPRIDILIDDGGHTMKQQINTFEELFSHVDKNGVYLCEDLHTSYWPQYGGGYKNPQSFIEYSKNFIDSQNAWHSRNKAQLDITTFTKTAQSLHYYDSVIVIEKREVVEPSHHKTGTPRVTEYKK